jgi:3',5'-cyclic AMP phosphodiesterase CpdA
MAARILVLGGVLLLLISCRYDLDVTGFVYTPVPVKERFEKSVQWNSDHPPRETMIEGDNYTVLVGSDSHVGGTHNLSCMISQALEEGAAMIAIAGDLSTGWPEDYDIAVAELEGAGTIPVCVVPGNHDLYFGGWESFFSNFGASAYTMAVHTTDTSDLFIFLDTGGGTLGSGQLEWLKQLLQEQREDYRYATVITHVNFFRNRFTTSTNILNEEVIVLLDLFAKQRVDIVIQGHDHKRHEELFGSTTYITLDALKDGTGSASFLQLHVGKEKISYNFIDLNL